MTSLISAIYVAIIIHREYATLRFRFFADCFLFFVSIEGFTAAMTTTTFFVIISSWDNSRLCNKDIGRYEGR